MPPRGATAPAPPKSKTVEWRKWKGLNKTDARVAISDEEFAWLENAITVGDGAVQILPGVGASIATIAAGIHSIWGFTLNGSPVLITVNLDGSASQIAVPSGTVTPVCGAGVLGTDTHLTIWEASPVLFIDDTLGYMSWDGTTFTVIDATIKGRTIAAFEGRVWIGNGRTIQYSAPDTYNDFAAANGAGSVIITDAAFEGSIVQLTSALEELWTLGNSSVEALANVTASGTPPNVLTSFSITNILTNLGSPFPHSVIGYLRALAFAAPFGFYALSGVTPQKLSAKLDGLLPFLTLLADSDVTAAVAVVQNLLVLLFAVPYTGTEAQARQSPLTLLLGFAEGKWFSAVQNPNLVWITNVVVSGVAEAWGTDGSGVFQLFGATASTPVTYKIQSKLYSLGGSTTIKAMKKVGIEIEAPYAVNPTLTIDSEGTSETINATFSNQVTWLNNMGQVVTWLNNALGTVNWLSTGTVLSRANSAQFGHYLGWTLKGTDPPYRMQAMAFEYVPTREWDQP